MVTRRKHQLKYFTAKVVFNAMQAHAHRNKIDDESMWALLQFNIYNYGFNDSPMKAAVCQ